MRILVTGCAGFIGMHLSHKLLSQGHEVIGVDSLNAYYDVKLKHARLSTLQVNKSFHFYELDLAKKPEVEKLFLSLRFDRVLHLAAQPGVRYSLINPDAYIQSNLVAFSNVIEAVHRAGIPHFVYASSSSVYGLNQKIPFSESDSVDHPASLYAATKKSNELMAHTYSHVFKLPTTGLRFFTVYGPWGRPDMSPMLFANSLLKGETIELFNFGKMRRDFTYVSDIIEGIIRVMDVIPVSNASQSPYEIYNIGNNKPVELLRFVEVLEDAFGKKAKIKLAEMQPGDVVETYADIHKIEAATGYRPTTSIEQGIAEFARWFKDYYHV
jgi:UDP-glucuronate 4-epimerase